MWGLKGLRAPFISFHSNSIGTHHHPHLPDEDAGAPRVSGDQPIYYETPQTRETAREGPASTGTWVNLSLRTPGGAEGVGTERQNGSPLERNAIRTGQNIKLPLKPLESTGPCPREEATKPAPPSPEAHSQALALGS